VLIVKGLINYRNHFLRSTHPKLEHIRAKLQQIAADAVREAQYILTG
jgi:hypothetical protein